MLSNTVKMQGVLSRR